VRIVRLDPEPLATFDYLNAGPGGRTEVRALEVLRAVATGLPAGVDGMVLTADLQGRERLPGKGRLGVEGPRLAGEAVAEWLAGLCAIGRLPPAERVGVLLAGDLWSEPGCVKRGGLGDVTPVWHTFAQHFRWVAGVLGNHDLLPESPGAGCHVLDGKAKSLDGLRVGGVGGIVGKSSKPNRRPPDEFTDLLARVLIQSPDVVLLHGGPDDGERLGEPVVREALEAYAPPLAVFGHCHWDEPLGRLETGTQLCNVDGRVVVAVRG
jgi:Icc protein